MTDLTIVILVGNEEFHIARCLDKLAALDARQIIVVDSDSQDLTQTIVLKKIVQYGNVEYHNHRWPGNQAAQFQWVLESLHIKSEWILRIDADEYLSEALIDEIKEKLPQLQGVDGVVLKRRHVVGWLNDRWVKRGMYPVRILRIFRRGKGRSDMKLMDEHIVVEGKIVEFENDFVDHSLISFVDWQAKHRNYARREAQSYLSGENSAGAKAVQKAAYYKLPRYVRAVMYFCIRYFLKGGFLEGVAGWRWNFWQGLWYRWLVDKEIGKMKKAGRS